MERGQPPPYEEVVDEQAYDTSPPTKEMNDVTEPEKTRKHDLV
jgi:hypothetical protein